jgi:hypothetical protein
MLFKILSGYANFIILAEAIADIFADFEKTYLV